MESPTDGGPALLSELSKLTSLTTGLRGGSTSPFAEVESVVLERLESVALAHGACAGAGAALSSAPDGASFLLVDAFVLVLLGSGSRVMVRGLGARSGAMSMLSTKAIRRSQVMVGLITVGRKGRVTVEVIM